VFSVTTYDLSFEVALCHVCHKKRGDSSVLLNHHPLEKRNQASSSSVIRQIEDGRARGIRTLAARS